MGVRAGVLISDQFFLYTFAALVDYQLKAIIMEKENTKEGEGAHSTDPQYPL